MLKTPLDQLFEYVAQNTPSDQVMLAKMEYQKTTGEIYEDDKSYNMRMALFLEWYLLDYYAPGKQITPLESMIEENPTSWVQGGLEVYKSISNNIQALYEVKKIRENTVTVLDLFTDEKYQVYEEDSKLAFRKNDIFQGRIVFHQGKYFFTGYYSFHPLKAQRYIKGEAKKIYLIQRIWKKELNQLEKKLAKIQKLYLKFSTSIEKIKNKIYNTDIEERLSDFNKELLTLESDLTQTAVSSQEIEREIVDLKHDKFKIEGRRLISDLINKLAYMNLKWERSRQIEILDIYKN
jgi:hypothetical protein